ncbi:hypothetical protein Kpho02_16510 [Kitasatospora phosalacinea]|uniref:Uncharacterized protein n=1 Tax=Kitasatospora phosalacinea TaxID=2065 RepID=A0A9W6Q3Z4_9ACTN|nr:DUF2568 domain-containing protein [Kitasatospora phosalacinea]GLW69352.1 hypothetical protein Kpho02_16510 [Kitasatospora phosalacinea]
MANGSGGGTGGLTPLDVAAFAAELAVYVAVGWWAWSLPLRRLRAHPPQEAVRPPQGPVRPPRKPVRLLFACAAVAGFALLWGWFAAPTADLPLHGAARVAFEVCWFGAGAAAALHASARRWRSV